jgi:hypothetical protein
MFAQLASESDFGDRSMLVNQAVPQNGDAKVFGHKRQARSSKVVRLVEG